MKFPEILLFLRRISRAFPRKNRRRSSEFLFPASFGFPVKKNSYFSEISYGSFSRTIPLPWDLKYNDATAEFNNGVLSINIPKSSDEQGKKKKISITHK